MPIASIPPGLSYHTKVVVMRETFSESLDVVKSLKYACIDCVADYLAIGFSSVWSRLTTLKAIGWVSSGSGYVPSGGDASEGCIF